MCDSVLNKYEPDKIQPNAGLFNYHHGVFLSGMERIYHITGEKKYFNYIKGWADALINEDGEIVPSDNPWCSLQTLDYRQAGILLIGLYRATKDKRYRKALTYLVESLKEYPVNSRGVFWHFAYSPNEVWLDGLYMASPLMSMYAQTFDKPDFFDMAAHQAITMYENMRDRNGLLHHGWDETKQAPWADSVSGLSKEVWGRACGWFVVAVADILDYLPADHEKKQQLVEILEKAIKDIIKYQEPGGRWYQVVDKGEEKGNWIENSCTCLFLYALAKCIRKGYLPLSYTGCLEKGFDAVLDSLKERDGNPVLNAICAGTNIEDGSYRHYINRPTVENDLHGTGAFVLMCSEVCLVS